MQLTDVQVKTAKAKEKPYKLTDGRGLYLLVSKTKTGETSKYWRLKYYYANKEKTLALGVYPDVPLKLARRFRDEARTALAEGADPAEARRAEKAARLLNAQNNFEAIAEEWLEKERNNWSPAHLKKQQWLLQKHLYPYIGSSTINSIPPPQLLAALRRIENRGALETARRAKQVSSQIFRYGICTGRCERDPAADLNGALKAPKVSHYPAITEPKAVGRLLNMIDDYDGSTTVKAALRLAPFVFVRPGELRRMEWSEINFDEAKWTIPEHKMKMCQSHIVPLSEQALDILRDQFEDSGHRQYVFPSERTWRRPISDNSLNAGLRRIGITKDEMVAHGFRAMARTLLDEELGFEIHLIEHQLAHEVRDALGRAYNRTKHLPQRVEMMQKWADYLEQLKASAIP